jgi:1,2-phenylacetyl-CoA epoxidase catalytic subunit
MTKRLLLCFLAAALALSTGCMFFRKSKQAKESSAVATATEQEFRQRWMAKRVTELNAQGVNGMAAREQADREFHEKFEFAVPSK